MWLCVGVVFEDHNKKFVPGDKRTATIGFDARLERIYDAEMGYDVKKQYAVYSGKKATGNGRTVLSSIWRRRRKHKRKHTLLAC